MKIISEGVLILASSRALMNRYKVEDFNYEFPAGLEELLNNQEIIAITTLEGDDLLIEITQNSYLQEDDFDNEINQCISFESADELLILSHADFTQICDFKKGNYRDYKWPIQKIGEFEKAMFHFNIQVKDVSKEFEKYKAIYLVRININKAENIKLKNEVVDII